MKQLLSPKQVAASVGVSESSLKRWCDQGHIPIERTPGGHRRIRLRDAVQFIRHRGDSITRPEQIGLPTGLDTSPTTPLELVDPLTTALDQGDPEASRRLVFNCYLGGATLAAVCDDLITPAMHRLGNEWQCGRLEIFQERRACELVNQLLFELHAVAPRPRDGAPVAIGGSPEGDHYRLATLMVALALLEAGWHATSLGTSLPLETLATAARRQKPDLLWLSISHCGDESAMNSAVVQLAEQIPESTKFLIGGQAASPAVINGAAGVVTCDSLAGLQRFVGDNPPTSSASS